MEEEQCTNPDGHCWHSTGIAYMTFPPAYPEYCCHCNAQRVRGPEVRGDGHGEYFKSLFNLDDDA